MLPAPRPSLVWPLLLVGLGALLLLQTLGLLSASLWPALAQLWPVLLILAGLDLLFGRRSARGAALVLGLGVALVAGSLLWAAVRASQLPPGGVETLIQVPQGATRLSAQIDFQSGVLRVGALGPSDHLLEGSAHDGPGESARQDYAVSAGEGRLRLQQQPDALLAPFLTGRADLAQWEVRLTGGLPVALTVNSGAGAARLDLTGLQLTRLDLTSGLGQTEVIFAPGQTLPAALHTGLGPTTLTLPASAAARLTIRSGQVQVHLPATLAPAGDNAYTTAGFDPAQPYLDIELNAGLGSVTVQ